jgi:hypothetical protein
MLKRVYNLKSEAECVLYSYQSTTTTTTTTTTNEMNIKLHGANHLSNEAFNKITAFEGKPSIM